MTFKSQDKLPTLDNMCEKKIIHFFYSLMGRKMEISESHIVHGESIVCFRKDVRKQKTAYHDASFEGTCQHDKIFH